MSYESNEEKTRAASRAQPPRQGDKGASLVQEGWPSAGAGRTRCLDATQLSPRGRDTLPRPGRSWSALGAGPKFSPSTQQATPSQKYQRKIWFGANECHTTPVEAPRCGPTGRWPSPDTAGGASTIEGLWDSIQVIKGHEIAWAPGAGRGDTQGSRDYRTRELVRLKRARTLEERIASIEWGHRIQGNCRLSDTVIGLKTADSVKYWYGPGAGEGGRVGEWEAQL